MRDRRSTFTKEYINNIVNPLGNRPARPTENHNSRVTEERVANPEPAGETNKIMLMPTAGIAATSEADSLVGGLGSIGVLGTAGSLNGTGVQNKDTTYTKLFVGGLPYHTSDKSLRDHFAVYGDIDEAVVITDRNTGKSRGYGFVSTVLFYFFLNTMFNYFNILLNKVFLTCQLHIKNYSSSYRVSNKFKRSQKVVQFQILETVFICDLNIKSIQQRGYCYW